MRIETKNIWFIRISGCLVIYMSFLQLIFLATYSNTHIMPVVIIFFISLFSIALFTTLSVLNSWNFPSFTLTKVKEKKEPMVATLIPTYGEPVEMVLKTVRSVLNQNYPAGKMVIVVGDDGHNPEMEKAIKELNHKVKTTVFYHLPPKKGDPERKGEAKSGNLNSCFNFIQKKFPHIEFIETRDADDLVGDPDFLRYCTGSLINDPEAAFVQTVKQAIVSDGDPFYNQEEIFYERTMMYRAADNSVFPCGSGLVWKKADLQKINGFPIWNLVEDLQSGYEILKHKRRGNYLPIVGALGQIAPEDIPNYYKQRGTWAIDTLRLFFWDNPIFARGLNFKQRLQFFEHFSTYLLSIPLLVFILINTACIKKEFCVINNLPPSFLIVNAAFIITTEIHNYLRSENIPYIKTWRARQNWIGLSPVFIISTFKAIFYGPRKKPNYKVTRKKHQFSFYWLETAPQFLLFTLLTISITTKVITGRLIDITDIILVYWGLFLMFGYQRVIKNSWFGKDLKKIYTKMVSIINFQQKPDSLPVNQSNL